MSSNAGPSDLITRPGPWTVPYTLDLGATDVLSPESIFATYDGSGASGAFVPAVAYYAPDGSLIGRYVLPSALAAGASADITWFPSGGLGGSSNAVAVQYEVKVISDTSIVVTVISGFVFAIPSDVGGMKLTAVATYVSTVSSSGLVTVQIRNATTGNNMLATACSIDANEFTSYTAATPPVIDGAHAQVSTGDRIAIDVTAAGTGAEGLGVILSFG